jgi:uncharacterized SAM-binding protein YcdF (DUF218 family)
VGFVLGLFIWTGAVQLGLGVFPFFSALVVLPWAPTAAGVAGAVLSLARLQSTLWAAGAGVAVLIALVTGTPISGMALQGILRSDPLAPCDAAYVLGSSLHPDGSLPTADQARLLHAYALIGQGTAPRLLVTRLQGTAPSYLPAISRQMRMLGLGFPVEEAGEAVNTHDEAVNLARIARERGWKRILLISTPSHMRRAGAVFERAGVPVVCSPCPETRYDIRDPQGPDGRLAVFRDWLREAVGYEVYRFRRWV